jgi:hypothetical protein
MNLLQKLFPLNVFLLLTLYLTGQTFQPNIPDKYKNLPKGTVIYSFMDGDSVSHTHIELPDSLKRYIVEFTEQPLYAIGNQNNLKSISINNSQLQKIDQQHNQFTTDFSRLTNGLTPGLKSQQVPGGAKPSANEFRKVFNGVSITADKNLIDQIERFSYVKKVYPDNMVEVVDDESNHVIKADSVWEKYGATGKGVVIGIIDTGIDSTHQDLSHGKVIGGYDFVNSDNNPMDDHGHGTHCAGIAAANGPGLKGVAPDAKLMAIKVLNEWGSGYDSWIIAGIEYAVDPDGNPLTDDGVDIISMSLGAPNGDPGDPMSTAVNNAYRKGVLCVIAAGNNGSLYNTIGTPGCAHEALTVGASDKNDNIAYFSSRGPSLNSFEIKPNVLAPGYDIHSSIPNNGYANWNGTSMATPHVSGAAALVKEIHPNWNAQKLRSSIVHSAMDVKQNYDVWTQGNGRMDILKAARVSSALSTNSLNFGMIPDSVSFFERKDIFYVYNLSDKTLNYSLSIPDSFPKEIKLSLSTNHFTLGVADSQLVILSLSADNTTLPFPSTPLAAYTGKIIIDDGIQPQNLFFSMIKSHSLNIKFDFVPWCVLIHDNNSIRNYYYPQGITFSTLLPTGTYDVIVCNLNSFIVRENIDISQKQDLEISLKEAKNKVEFKGIDPNGIPLQIFDVSPECLILKNRPYETFGFTIAKSVAWDGYTIPPIVRYFSDLPAKYRYEISPLVFPHNNSEHNWYNIPFLLDHQIISDTVIINDQNDFVKINYHINDFGSDIDSIYYTNSYWSLAIAGFTDLYDVFDTAVHILTPPYIVSKNIIPSPDNQYRINRVFGLRLHKLEGKINPTKDSLLFGSENFTCFKDSGKVMFANPSSQNQRVIVKNIDIQLNVAPIFFNSPLYFYTESKDLQLRKVGTVFSDQDYGYVNQKIPFTFSSDSSIILQDSILNKEIYNGDVFHLPIKYNTNYELKVYDIQYSINHRLGKSNSTFYKWIDSLNIWSNYMMPINQLHIKSDNRIANLLNPVEKNTLSLTLNMDNYKKVHILIKTQNDSIWNDLYIYDQKPGVGKNIFDINLPDTLQNDYYSLNILLIESDKDSSIHVFEPAFYILSDLESDSIALVDLYSSTNGKEWINNSNWLKTKVKDWYGVTIEKGRVVGINLPNNNLKGSLPSGLENLTKLRTLTLNDNYLDAINDLSLLENLISLNIANNQLTFEDIIPNLNIESITYIPQRKIGREQELKLIENDLFEINTFFSEEGSSFFWFKNSRRVSGVNTPLLAHNAASKNDEGNYICFIMNENVPGLTLETYPFVVSVNSPLFIDRSDLLDDLNVYSYGGSWIDFDNDGDQDLFIVNNGSSNQLLQNMFSETDSVWFKDITETAMGYDKSSSVSSTWGDVNNDGYIDAFIVNQNYTEPKMLFLNNGDGTFRKLEDSVIKSQLRYSNTANLVDLNRDGWLDLFIGNTYHNELTNNNNQMFINRGNLTFENYQDQNQSLTSSLYNHSVSWFDVDNDFDLDVFVSSYGMDVLLINYDGQFLWPSGDTLWFQTSVNCQTNSAGDFDNDGDVDIFSGHGGWYWSFINDPKNVLYENKNGKLTPFQDSSLIADNTNYFSSSWGDYDNDGDLDLLGTSFYGVTNLWTNQLQETGTVSFKKVDFGATAGYIMGGRGCSFADYDNDGDLDIFVDGSQYENHLFENVIGTKNNWINMKCIGTKSNASAIGTRVKLKATINKKPCWQLQEISSQTGYSGQNSMNVEFGLGNAIIIDSIQVFWPSGIYWDTTGVAINQFMEIIEPEKVNDIPQIFAFNDTLINENVPFIHSYQIVDEWNRGIFISIVKKPYWLYSTVNGKSISFKGTPDDYSPGVYDLILSFYDGFINTPIIDSLKIEVINVNDAPIIKGQIPLSFRDNGPIKILLNDLIVEDVDNVYPADFHLIINKGSGYSISADTIFPVKNKILFVPVQVSDGLLSSNIYNLKIDFNTDVSDELISDLKIYPNPFDDFIRINSSPNVTIQMVEVFDLLGKNVTSFLSCSKNEYIIDCSKLDQTLYLLKITTNDNSFIQKLIKKR